MIENVGDLERLPLDRLVDLSNELRDRAGTLQREANRCREQAGRLDEEAARRARLQERAERALKSSNSRDL